MTTLRALRKASPSPKTGEPRFWIMEGDDRVGMVTVNRLGNWYAVRFGSNMPSRGSTDGQTPTVAARRLLDGNIDYWGNPTC